MVSWRSRSAAAARRGPRTQRGTVITAIAKATRATLAAAGCAALIAAGITGCDTVQQLSAAQKVQSAFRKLTEGRALAGELSLDAGPDQLRSFAKLTGEELDQQDAETLSRLSLAFSVTADKPLKDVPAPASGTGGAFGLNGDSGVDLDYAMRSKGGDTMVELRQVDGRLYARADVQALARLSGEDPGDLGAMEDELPPELKVFRQALEGRWLAVDARVLKKFGDRMQHDAGATPGAAPSLDAGAQRRLMDALKSVLAEDVSFEEKGQQDGAQRIVVSAPARTLVRDLQKAVQPLTGSIPALRNGLSGAGTEQIPDRTVSAELRIKDGAITSLSLDLAQLQAKAGWGDHLPLKLSFSRQAAPVQAPSGATVLTQQDLDQISRLMSGELGAPGGPAGSDAGSFSPDDSGLPDQV
ncbi:hypothetical protein [Peterkaempfera griseoplana]|uniref:hypothetical protein n=1 Tax=Peterkaempfera griseoplana TaxID=66896 RepID=UPI0006E468A3|nr:hypothetical protein [Peterkaempfera griseoplana]